MTGRVMAGEVLQRKNIRIEDVSPYLITSVIAAEDARFCSHIGIDREAIEKAIEDNKKGGTRRGGSTITQQTAKNLFFWNGGGIARKAGEAYAALLIDTLWSKERIMEHYLNIAEWGDGIFGAEAAAEARFGKPASALTAYEAALLASVLPSPNKWRLDPPSEFVSGRARTINARAKVTAREGYADCVLENLPAYNGKASSPAAPQSKAAPQPKAVPEVQKGNETTPSSQTEPISETVQNTAEEQIAPAQPPQQETALTLPSNSSNAANEEPALEDLLSEMQDAAQQVRESEPSVSQEKPPSVPVAPRDIRPPALDLPAEQNTDE